jgi:hypothetical protein
MPAEVELEALDPHARRIGKGVVVVVKALAKGDPAEEKRVRAVLGRARELEAPFAFRVRPKADEPVPEDRRRDARDAAHHRGAPIEQRPQTRVERDARKPPQPLGDEKEAIVLDGRRNLVALPRARPELVVQVP